MDEGGRLSVKRIDSEPGDGETLVRVLYSGINPADHKHATLGIMSTFSGYEFCGAVEKVGPNSMYQLGDIIAGCTPTGVGRPTYRGTHQNYILCTDDLAFKVPNNLPAPHAASLAVAFRTAADALFNFLHYPLPGDTQAEKPHGPLLIWGGSTSLGWSAIQLAKEIGVSPIIVTASERQHQVLLDLGSTKCFDYKDKAIVEQIRSYVAEQNEPLLKIFDTVGSLAARTADQAASWGDSNATVLTSTFSPKFQMPFAYTDFDIELEVPGGARITIPRRTEDATRVRKALRWAIENYGSRFNIPKLQIISGKGQDAIESIHQVADFGAGFGKIVIEHPIIL